MFQKGGVFIDQNIIRIIRVLRIINVNDRSEVILKENGYLITTPLLEKEFTNLKSVKMSQYLFNQLKKHSDRPILSSLF